jgi:hypothetical protein
VHPRYLSACPELERQRRRPRGRNDRTGRRCRAFGCRFIAPPRAMSLRDHPATFDEVHDIGLPAVRAGGTSDVRESR